MAFRKRNAMNVCFFIFIILNPILTLTLDLDSSKYPNTTPFLRTDIDLDAFKIVVNTKPLFENLPKTGQMNVQTMTLDDLKSSSKQYKNLCYIFII